MVGQVCLPSRNRGLLLPVTSDSTRNSKADVTTSRLLWLLSRIKWAGYKYADESKFSEKRRTDYVTDKQHYGKEALLAIEGRGVREGGTVVPLPDIPVGLPVLVASSVLGVDQITRLEYQPVGTWVLAVVEQSADDLIANLRYSNLRSVDHQHCSIPPRNTFIRRFSMSIPHATTSRLHPNT
ncbi:unnamed protein product, partial [Choristocarpus tenellus]